MRIEDAHDARVQAARPVVGHRERFGTALGLVVTAARADGVHVSPVALGLRMDEWVAIHLRRRREHETGVVGARQLEQVECAERAHFQRLDRMCLVADRRRRRGQVQHHVHIAVHLEGSADVNLDEAEPSAADFFKVLT